MITLLLKKIISNIRSKKIASYGWVIALGIFLPVITFAAGFSVTPSNYSATTGKTFTVNVNVNTAGQIMNAASGSLSFPKDVIEVVSVSKSGSIINLWVQDPQFSNALGIVSFEGIVLNPGFTGTGKILTVTFRTKNAGAGTFSFSNGSVLANDGSGTNILKSLGTGTVTVTAAPIPEPEPLKPTPTPVVPTPVPQVEIPPIITDEPIDELLELSELPLPPRFVDAPFINNYNPIITKGSSLLLTGTISYPNTEVVITIIDKKNRIQQITTQSDSNGSFAVEISGTTKGTYQFWAQVIYQGVVSGPTNKNTFVVQSPYIITIGEHAIGVLIIILILGAILFMIMALFIQAWHTLFKLKKKVFKDINSTEIAVHNAFQTLQEDIRDHIMLLEITKTHRKLTPEETKVLRSLVKNSNHVEQFVIDHLEHIKKDL
jgi:hypothetical protein